MVSLKRRRALIGLAAIAAGALLVSSCKRSVQGVEGYPRNPSLILEIHLTSSSDYEEFSRILKQISTEKGLTFRDASEETEKNAADITRKRGDIPDNSIIINESIGDGDGLWVFANNIGMSGSVIRLSIFYSSDINYSREIADYVMRRISERWTINRLKS